MSEESMRGWIETATGGKVHGNILALPDKELPPAVTSVYADADHVSFTLSWGEEPGVLELCPGGDAGAPRCDFGRPHRVLNLTADAAHRLYEQLGELFTD